MNPKQKKIVIVALVGVLLIAAVSSQATTILDNEYDMFKFQIDYIIDKWESSDYEDVSGDRGGGTKFGITEKDYPSLNIKSLSRQQALDIFWKDYWKRGKLNQIPPQIQFMQFAGTVNFGVTGQIRALQDAANVTIDGVIGHLTLLAAQSVTPRSLFLAQKARYDRIVANDSSQQKFYPGWINRINDIYKQQLSINQYG